MAVSVRPAPAHASSSVAQEGAATARHFDLYVGLALLRLREQLPGLDEAMSEGGGFAFLQPYYRDLTAASALDAARADWLGWTQAIDRFEEATTDRLPIRAIRQAAGLDHLALSLLFVAGLVDEDARFGSLFHALQPEGLHRPSASLLCGWAATTAQRQAARRAVSQLCAHAILEPATGDWHSGGLSLQPAAALWAVLRGDLPDEVAPWARYRSAESAMALGDLVLPAATLGRLRLVPELLDRHISRALVVRGPRSSGRATVLRAIARELGRGTLEVDATTTGDSRWRLLGPMAAALNVMPVVRLAPELGQAVELQPVRGFGGPLGLTLPRRGRVVGDDIDAALQLELDIPRASERGRHWLAALGPAASDQIEDLARSYRMSGGSIRRAAAAARASARLGGRAAVGSADVREAMRGIRGDALESLAPAVDIGGAWSDLVVEEDTNCELSLLEHRCRHREDLLDALPPAIGVRSAGVRALLSGPSGTGKTLAARLLTSVLQMDLHVLELSSVVDKYLGETEKNLSAVFERAAELDVVLLIDEGDALMTRRTDVHSSNDRYANLQTNHLLQQLEAHDGIVLVTTNAGERIDSAFQRRFDVVIEFRPPDAGQRWQLWHNHLRVDHSVADSALSDIALRCELTGGQIRNAVLHAWLLAAAGNGAGSIQTDHLEEAVRREYRKAGATCPLPRTRRRP
jgi:hypothetical protein